MGIRIYNQMAGGLLTNSSGGVTLPTGQFLAAGGTAGAPAYSWTSDADTGFYNVGDDKIYVSTGADLQSYFTAAGVFSRGFFAANPTAGLGYSSGAGGVVTQSTSKATGVTLSTVSGAITCHNAALAASALVTFTVTNTAVAATDLVTVTHSDVGTLGAYHVQAHTITAGSFKISLFNHNGSSLSEAIVLRFAIIKGASA